MSILAPDEEIAAGHFLRFLHSEKEQKRRRDIGQDSVFAPELVRVFRDVNEMNEICRVRGVR